MRDLVLQHQIWHDVQGEGVIIGGVLAKEDRMRGTVGECLPK